MDSYSSDKHAMKKSRTNFSCPKNVNQIFFFFSTLQKLFFFLGEEDPLTILGNDATSDQTGYHCTKCDKSYSWRTSLLRHLREECKVIPKYSCHQCGRRFKRAYHLRRHQRSKRPCYFQIWILTKLRIKWKIEKLISQQVLTPKKNNFNYCFGRVNYNKNMHVTL